MKLPLPCNFCGEVQEVELSLEQIREIQAPNRRAVQDIVPELPAEQRELFISGMCSECWEQNFGTDEPS